MFEPIDERGRDALGFIAQLCPFCGAHMYLGDQLEARPICLNACTLPAWQYRLLISGLRAAAAPLTPPGAPPSE